MELSATAPRVTVAESRTQEPVLPLAVRALRFLVYALTFALMLLFLSGGTPQSKLLYPCILAIGIMNPLWALYALALYGPLFLFDQGKTHLLVAIEVLLLGAVCGELRLLGRRDVDALARVTPEATDPDSLSDPGSSTRAPVGLWPWWFAAVAVMLLSSVIIGIKMQLFREDEIAGRPDRLYATLMNIYYNWATGPDYPLRALWNWFLGMAAAVLAFRRATPLRAARWLKFGGIGLLGACLLSLLDYYGLVALDHFRWKNLDPFHAGRLQGLAGHAGWYAQWIVLMWPGLLLWWPGAGRRRRLAIGVVLGLIVFPALFLTAARASWLAVLVGSAVAGSFFFLRRRDLRPWIIGALVLLALACLAAMGMSDVVLRRLETLLRVSDRLNYYSSALILLQEFPFGTGLGMHYHYYTWWLPQYFAYYQSDHVTSHSFYLHSMAENGPFFLALLLFGAGALMLDVKRGWSLLSPGAQYIIIAFGVGAGGLFVVGAAQYFPFIRIIEVCAWIAFGFVAGIVRREAPQRFLATSRMKGVLLLSVAAIAAAAGAYERVQRPLEGRYPRFYEWNHEAKGFEFWMDRVWVVPMDPEITQIRFKLLRHAVSGTTEYRIEWPDGTEESGMIHSGETLSFAHDLAADPPSRIARRRWLTVKVGDSWIPARTLPDSQDQRPLGVWVHEFDVSRETASPKPAR